MLAHRASGLTGGDGRVNEKSEERPEKRVFHHKLSVQAGAYQN